MSSNGSGLGLYIVKEAIEKLGGTISIESEIGVGSTVSLEIPNETRDRNLPEKAVMSMSQQQDVA